VYPGGRLGNQLYFAAAAEVLRAVLVSRNMSIKIVWHSNSDYLQDIHKITGFRADEIRRHKFIGKLISGEKPLSHRGVLPRSLYSLWLRKNRFKKFEIPDRRYEDILQVPRASGYNIIHFHQERTIAEQAAHKWEDHVRSYSENLIERTGLIIKGDEIAVSMRFGDFLHPRVAEQQGNLTSDFSGRRCPSGLIKTKKVRLTFCFFPTTPIWV